MQLEPLDFDKLMEMAQKSPDKLELLRKCMIQEVIDSADEAHKHRLEGLQFKIDMEIRRAKTPLASCIKISQMMHESVVRLREHLDINKPPASPVQFNAANIICFNAGRGKLKHKELMVN